MLPSELQPILALFHDYLPCWLFLLFFHSCQSKRFHFTSHGSAGLRERAMGLATKTDPEAHCCRADLQASSLRKAATAAKRKRRHGAGRCGRVARGVAGSLPRPATRASAGSAKNPNGGRKGGTVRAGAERSGVAGGPAGCAVCRAKGTPAARCRPPGRSRLDAAAKAGNSFRVAPRDAPLLPRLVAEVPKAKKRGTTRRCGRDSTHNRRRRKIGRPLPPTSAAQRAKGPCSELAKPDTAPGPAGGCASAQGEHAGARSKNTP